MIDNTDLHLAASFYTNEGDKNITNLTLSREKKQHQKSAAYLHSFHADYNLLDISFGFLYPTN